MKKPALPPVDVVMLGTFAMWRLGTLQARALPFARSMRIHGVSTAIVTTPWDMPSEAGIVDLIDGVAIINTRSSSARNPVPAVRQQLDWVKDLQPKLVHLMKPKGFGGMAARLLNGDIPLVVDSDDWEGDGGWNDAAGYSWSQRKVFQYQEYDLLKRAVCVTAASTTLADRTALLRNEQVGSTFSVTTPNDPTGAGRRHANQLRMGLIAPQPGEIVAVKGLEPGRSEDVFLIENGIETSWMEQLAAGRTRPPSTINPPVIVLYSRFAEFGFDWLPTFTRALSASLDTPATLRIIGDLPEPAASLVETSTLTIDRMGCVARGELPELLGSSTVAVYPYEDSLITRSKQSVKLLELMAAGCPVIGSDVGDISRTVGNAGRILAGADPEAFASAVVEVLSGPATLDRMSADAAKRIRDRFNFDYLSGKLLSAYRAAGLS